MAMLLIALMRIMVNSIGVDFFPCSVFFTPRNRDSNEFKCLERFVINMVVLAINFDCNAVRGTLGNVFVNWKSCFENLPSLFRSSRTNGGI